MTGMVELKVEEVMAMVVKNTVTDEEMEVVAADQEDLEELGMGVLKSVVADLVAAEVVAVAAAATIKKYMTLIGHKFNWNHSKKAFTRSILM